MQKVRRSSSIFIKMENFERSMCYFSCFCCWQIKKSVFRQGQKLFVSHLETNASLSGWAFFIVVFFKYHLFSEQWFFNNMSLHFIRVYLYVKMILGENYFKFIRLLNVFTFLRIKVILLEQFKNKKTILTTFWVKWLLSVACEINFSLFKLFITNCSTMRSPNMKEIKY